MHEVVFQVLGPLKVSLDGQPIPLQGMKHRTVLGCLLTFESHFASVGRLVDAVWGSTPPDTAEKQIRNAVSGLRKILSPTGAAVTAVADGYHLEVDSARIDLHRFREHVGRAREYLTEQRSTAAVAEFRAALSLWKGEMLSGIESDVLQAQAVAVNEIRLGAVEDCAELELAQGAAAGLVGELAGWAADHPLRERLVSLYILALHRSGARTRAFAVYEETRRQLAEQLGLGPGPRLREIHRLMLQEDTDAAPGGATERSSGAGKVLALSSERVPSAASPAPVSGAVSPPVPVPDNLPPEITHFVGRATEIRTLLDEAERPARCRILAIDGMPGVGKTVLAVRTAHHLVDQYPDGRIFLDLHGHSLAHNPLDPRGALRRLLLLTGAEETFLPDDVQELAALWRGRSSAMRLLLVMDNVADAEQVRPLLPAGDGCLTLLTSRRRLTMTTWSATHVLSLGPLPRADGRELFRRVLGSRGHVPRAATVDCVLALCSDVPLAIAAAAARLRRRPSWSPDRLAERLTDPRRLLADLQTEQGGIASRLDASYRHLSTGQQRLLRILGTAETDRWNSVSAAALAGLPPYVAEHMLEVLVDEHLLLPSDSDHYVMNPLVKTYCALLPEGDGVSADLAAPPARPTGDTAAEHLPSQGRRPAELVA